MNLSPDAQKVWETLSSALEASRLPHAVLLEGAAGSGADLLAHRLAQAAVCLEPGQRPCGHCAGCVKAQAGSHPDILLLDGDSDPKAFPIDAIRALRSGAYIRPNEAPRKVCVLLGAQNMAEASQNAFLKVLEEPPENVLFILTAANASALLPTVRSRTERFTLAGRPSPAFGEEAARVARAVTAAKGTELLFASAPLIQDKDKLRGVLDCLLLIFRDAAVLRSGGSAVLSGEAETAASLGEALTRGRLVRLYEETRRARRLTDRNANAALLVTEYCAALREAAGR